MAKIGKLNVEVGANAKPLKLGLLSAEVAVKKFGKQLKGFNVSSIGGIGVGGPIAMAAKAATAALATVGASGIAAAIAIKSGADKIDDLADSSKRLLGNSGATGALAGLRGAAEEAGVEAGLLDKGLEKLLDTISKANRGDKGAIQAFKDIGIDAKTIVAMKPEDRMIAVADALGKVKDAGDKISLAKGIFGKSGAGLIPLFNDGGEAIRNMTNSMALYGKSISALDAEKVGTMNDNIGRLETAWDGVTMQLAVHFAPLVTDLSNQFLGMIESVGGVGKAVDVAFDFGISAVSDLLDSVESLELTWMGATKAVNDFYLALYEQDPNDPIEKAREKNNTERRLKGIPDNSPKMREEGWLVGPAADTQTGTGKNRREQARKILEERGGFVNESPNAAAFLEHQKINQEYEKRKEEIAARKANRGTLGQRFKAWEQQAQMKGTASAAAKLADASKDRLQSEEDITKELKAQKNIQEAGQGKFKLLALNGITGTPQGKKTEKAKATEATGKAASSEKEVPSDTALGNAARSSTGLDRTDSSEPPFYLASNVGPAQEAASPGFGTKEYFDSKLGLPGARDRVAKKYGLGRYKRGGKDAYLHRAPDDTQAPKYESKKPFQFMPDYAFKSPNGPADWESKTMPGTSIGRAASTRTSLDAAVGGDPIVKAMQKDTEKQDKMIALLEKIAGNTKSPTLGLT